jgi:hypothetical protein
MFVATAISVGYAVRRDPPRSVGPPRARRHFTGRPMPGAHHEPTTRTARRRTTRRRQSRQTHSWLPARTRPQRALGWAHNYIRAPNGAGVRIDNPVFIHRRCRPSTIGNCGIPSVFLRGANRLVRNLFHTLVFGLATRSPVWLEPKTPTAPRAQTMKPLRLPSIGSAS